MATAYEFIDFVVPVSVIRKKFPGGWEQYLEDHRQLIGGRVWFDKHLFQDGAMNPKGIQALFDEGPPWGLNRLRKLMGSFPGKTVAR